MRRIVFLGSLGALLALPSAAAAEPRLTVSRSAAEPGQRVLVAGHGFAPAAQLRVRLGGTLVKRGQTGRRGGFRVRITVPGKRAGRYRLAARSERRLARRFFRIRAPAPAAPAPQPAPPAPAPEGPASAPPAAPPPAPPPPPPPTLVAAGDIACVPGMA